MEQGYKIEVSSHYNDWWRYNIAIMCEERDVKGNKLDIKGIMDQVAEVAADDAHELKERPRNVEPHRKVILECQPCHSARVYINIIPHSLPLDRIIDHKTKFSARVKITKGDKTVLNNEFDVNVWGGTTVDIVI